MTARGFLESGQAGAALTLVLLGAIGGCGSAAGQESVLNLRLSDGRLVGSLITSERPTALLLYDAATCLWCGTSLPRWEELERTGQVRVLIVLAGEPSKEQSIVLQTRRIPVAGHLRSAGGLTVPSEFVIEGDSVIGAAFGVADIRSRRLWRQPPFVVDSSQAVARSPIGAKGF